MSEYPKQLIQEISEHLDPKIIEFFDNISDDFDYPIDSIPSLVELTMESFFGGLTSKTDLGKICISQKHNRRRTRQRWFQSLENDLRILSPDDKCYPFHNLYIRKKTLKKSEWTTLFGNITFEELVNNLYSEAAKWQEDVDSLLISFPAIDSYSPKKIFKSLQSDTLISIYDYIVKEYNGSIENYFMSFPKQLLNIPIFSPGRTKLDTIPNEDKVLTNLYKFDEGTLITNVNTDGNNIGDLNIVNQLNTLNQIDLLILSMSIQNLDIDFFTTKQSRVKKSALAKILYSNNNPSKKHYMAMYDHCLKMSKYNFTIEYGDNGDKGNAISFNLLDSVDTRDPEYIVFTYGTLLYNNIINNKLTNIKSSHLHILEQPLSNILLHPLFSERVILSLQIAEQNTDTSIDIIKEYPYSFFHNNVRFSKRSKKNNMNLIEEALKEFVQKGIIISSYERLKNRDGFRIRFFPLTDEEMADLSYKRFPLPEKLLDKNNPSNNESI